MAPRTIFSRSFFKLTLKYNQHYMNVGFQADINIVTLPVSPHFTALITKIYYGNVKYFAEIKVYYVSNISEVIELGK